MGMAKDLRVCNYCARIVKDYAQSSGVATIIKADLKESTGSQLDMAVHRSQSVDMNSPEPKVFR